MAETWCLQNETGQVLFTFYAGPRGAQMVEVTIGANQLLFFLDEFNRDMHYVYEVAARRSGLHAVEDERS